MGTELSAGQIEICNPELEGCIEIGQDPECFIIGGEGSGGNLNQHVPISKGKGCNDIGCDCYFEDHQPALLWCNLCSIDGAVVSDVTGLKETSIQNVCDICESGQDFRFDGEFEYTVTLPSSKNTGAFLIYGHDLCKTGAEIQICADGVPVALKSHDGDVAIIAPDCDHCCTPEKQCKPIAIYYDCPNATVWTAKIKGAGTIRTMGFYQVFTDYMCLWEGGSNPFAQSLYEQVSKRTECGYLPPMLKPRMIQHDFTFFDVTEGFMCGVWEQIRDYGNRHSVYYAHSTNRQNTKVARAHNFRAESSSTLGSCTEELTVSMDLNMHSGIK